MAALKFYRTRSGAADSVLETCCFQLLDFTSCDQDPVRLTSDPTTLRGSEVTLLVTMVTMDAGA